MISESRAPVRGVLPGVGPALRRGVRDLRRSRAGEQQESDRGSGLSVLGMVEHEAETLQLVQRQEALARGRLVAAHVAAGVGALGTKVPKLGRRRAGCLKPCATDRAMAEIREALLGYAMINRRLPCPDTDMDGSQNGGGLWPVPPMRDFYHGRTWAPPRLMPGDGCTATG